MANFNERSNLFDYAICYAYLSFKFVSCKHKNILLFTQQLCCRVTILHCTLHLTIKFILYCNLLYFTQSFNLLTPSYLFVELSLGTDC
uniref:Uncharacterized protein n=1 Tax=Ciona intestinalis TaxID=7719 RepID=H2XZZ3_CIOIN